MRKLSKLLFMLFICFMVIASYGAAAQAACKMQIMVNVDDAKTFWNMTYLTSDNELGVATSVAIIWDLGTKDSQTSVVLTPGQDKSKFIITSEKGTMVNYRVSIRNAKNHEVGSMSMQVKNTGQTEYVLLGTPDTVEPTIVYGNEAAPAAKANINEYLPRN